MPGNIFVKERTVKNDLNRFARLISEVFGIGTAKQRESLNYVSEEYYIIRALGIELTIALSDDEEFEGYNYWLSLEPDDLFIQNQKFLDDLGDLMARKLAMSGYEVAMAIDFGTDSERKRIYKYNPKADSPEKEVVAIDLREE